jgi:hypothetical protein
MPLDCAEIFGLLGESVMSFTNTEISIIRQGLHDYRIAASLDGLPLAWDRIKDDLLISPATFGLKTGDAAQGGLNAEALRQFAIGQDVLTASVLTNLKSFLVYEKIIDGPP